ncbi:hypothetical protein BN1708_016990 [Verticillium longisporum]|uniref:Glutamine amidotransferase domain-containing protein n=1 Tax=Verticillium longisporum TaxID=100787 RepID=A0A0G4KDJ8_VERLO|nr:hypothetical protein BN1708_016990 [Verticillium longisporum]
MDAFKQIEIERMRLGGNENWKTFFEQHEDTKMRGVTWDDATIAERYSGEVGEEWKERLSAKAEGKEYETIYNLGRLMETSSVPIMGICLGHQLLALATGARTIKLKYGNRAHNIPALDLTTGQCHITSQNHGYAVDSSTLPSDFKEYFVNLNDGSNEGMMHKTRPIFSTQFHPEAKGGPMDSSYLFDKYLQSVQLFKDNQKVYRDNRPTQLMLDILSHERVGVEPVSLASAA